MLQYKINEKYRKIWELALHYQDKRNDNGHAFIVSIYAQNICEIEECNPDIVVPAAILHDIGWTQMSVEDRMSVFKYGVSKEERIRIRNEHQIKGVELAQQILKKADYDDKLHQEILEIISQHDTRDGFISNNEGAMRDADKLWRFDIYGFLNDNMNSQIEMELEIQSLEKKLNDEKFFYFKSSRISAENMLIELKNKYISN